MMKSLINTNRIFKLLLLLTLVTAWSSCKKFVEPKAPTSSINESNVYTSDVTAISAVTGIYVQMTSRFSGSVGMSVLTGLSADELTLANTVTDQNVQAYYKNTLKASPEANFGIDYWRNVFWDIFKCNAAIEGLSKSSSLTPAVKKQLLGETKFLRAFFNFYAVNLYGDIPLVLSTNPNETSVLPRSSKDKVFAQIVTDLKEAKDLLSTFFLNASLLNSTTERVRVTKWAATALLARVYLYTAQYANAEAEASNVIANNQFSFAPLNGVFLKNSIEAIWQLQPIEKYNNTPDAMVFVLPSTGPSGNSYPVFLSTQQLAAFESGDLRRKGGNWVDSVISGGVSYFYPAKYKATTTSGSSFTEYLMILRLAEQYLIRAEARAMQNNFGGAKDDLNMIRTRAGLGNTTANDQSSLLTAILKERRVELFTELGQRWFDLKRLGKIDEVMNIVTPLKGNANGWKSYQQLYPIPFNDIQLNPALKQNFGY
jgi:starch-binding outer membrane protein, SusD/RagB family